jgi:hypothetical protein
MRLSIGHLDKRLAKDAAGRFLATAFTLIGTNLTQHIDTAGARFPVTADPHYTWGWVTGTVYFNKRETLKAAASATYIGGIGAFAPSSFNVIIAAWAGWFALVASWAIENNKCLKIKSTGYAYVYSGGYCQ